MNFPSFGDAASYEQLGRACAEALAGRSGTVFEACYHPVRPPGAVFLMSLPYLVSGDPVDANYIALCVNVVSFALCVTAIAVALTADQRLLGGTGARGPLLGVVVFFAALLNLGGHIPVRLADLAGLAAFLCAFAVAAQVLTWPGVGRSARCRYAAAGALCAVAVLIKVSQAPVSVVLLAALLTLDGRARRGEALRRASAFLLPFSAVGLQFANVWAHTGRPWLYDSAYVERFFAHAPRRPSIEAVIYTIPSPNAYMAKTVVPLSRPTFVAVKMARGLFGFEWAVYHGQPSRDEWWDPRTAELVRAWALVLAYLAFSAACTWRGPPSLRLLNAVAAAGAVITGVLTHTELRYYALPRLVLWVTVAAVALQACLRPRAVPA